MTESLQIDLSHLGNAHLRTLLTNAEANGRTALAQAIRQEFARRGATGAEIRPRAPPALDQMAAEDEPSLASRGERRWAAAAVALLMIIGVSGLGVWQREWVRRVLLPTEAPVAGAPGRLPPPRAQVALARPAPVTPPRTVPLEASASPSAQAAQAELSATRHGREGLTGHRTRGRGGPPLREVALAATELARGEPERASAETEAGGAVEAGVLAVSRSTFLAEADCDGATAEVVCQDGRRAVREQQARRLADQPVKLTIPRALAAPSRAGAGPPR